MSRGIILVELRRGDLFICASHNIIMKAKSNLSILARLEFEHHCFDLFLSYHSLK